MFATYFLYKVSLKLKRSITFATKYSFLTLSEHPSHHNGFTVQFPLNFADKVVYLLSSFIYHVNSMGIIFLNEWYFRERTKVFVNVQKKSEKTNEIDGKWTLILKTNEIKFVWTIEKKCTKWIVQERWRNEKKRNRMGPSLIM